MTTTPSDPGREAAARVIQAVLAGGIMRRLDPYRAEQVADALADAGLLAALPGQEPAAGTEGPETSVPNRLLARLVGAGGCEHGIDYTCHDCMNEAMDAGKVLLEHRGEER